MRVCVLSVWWLCVCVFSSYVSLVYWLDRVHTNCMEYVRYCWVRQTVMAWCALFYVRRTQSKLHVRVNRGNCQWTKAKNGPDQFACMFLCCVPINNTKKCQTGHNEGCLGFHFALCVVRSKLFEPKKKSFRNIFALAKKSTVRPNRFYLFSICFLNAE